MDIMMMVTADYAADGGRGKFTLVGAGFTNLFTKKLPHVQPLMYLFVRLKIIKDDVGRNKIILRLMGEKGALARAEINMDIKPNMPNANEGFLNIPWQINNVKFENLGQYNFEIEVNGEPRLQQAINVIKQKPKSVAG